MLELSLPPQALKKSISGLLIASSQAIFCVSAKLGTYLFIKADSDIKGEIITSISCW